MGVNENGTPAFFLKQQSDWLLLVTTKVVGALAELLHDILHIVAYVLQLYPFVDGFKVCIG